MIASWMLYGLTVSLLVAGAAFVLERWMQRQGRAIRLIWAGALPISVLLPVAITMFGSRRGEQRGVILGEFEMIGGLPGLGVAAATPRSAGGMWLLEYLDPLLLSLWAVATAGLLAVAILGSIRLRSESSQWPERSVGSRVVKVSSDVGPAVVGLVRSRIVVPAWTLEAAEEVQKMIVCHEEEHIRARDPQLLGGAYVFLLVLPWNLPLWWMVHRLRLAIEIDCDRRVLARGADVRAYGVLLLDVSGHGSLGFAPALSNPADFLERRIRMITQKRRAGSWREPLLAVALAMLLLLVACEIDPPPLPVSDPEPSAAEADSGGIERVLGPRTIVVPPSAFEDGRIQSSTPQPAPRAGVDTPALPIIGSEGVTDPLRQGESEGDEEPSEVGREPVFTPMEIRPQLLNRDEFIQQLQRLYPPMLKDAAIGGTVNVWVFIDERGQVMNTRVQESSGYPQLDMTAEQLMREVADFSPATNRDQNVPVWISIPVTFEARR